IPGSHRRSKPSVAIWRPTQSPLEAPEGRKNRLHRVGEAAYMGDPPNRQQAFAILFQNSDKALF
ncbi:MAG: hypothetical protein OC190_09000, partial [Novosphingobium aromaticivorans]|nr:hypothetical protein [Novosphingobium aromaticivorans]